MFAQYQHSELQEYIAAVNASLAENPPRYNNETRDIMRSYLAEAMAEAQRRGIL